MNSDSAFGSRRVSTALAMPMVAIFAMVGCADSADEPEAASAVATSGPAAPAQMRTIESSAELVAQGQALFAGCAGCHGAQGEGRIGTGPSLNSETFLAASSDQFLIDTISNGRAGTTMIPWSGSYSPEQIEGIVAYIRSMNETAPAELDESPLEGDAAAGALTYNGICAACHGRTGAGYQETANGTGIGRRAFLDSATNGYLRYLIHNGKTNTMMQPFDEASRTAVANLTDQEIDNVIVHLRTSAW